MSIYSHGEARQGPPGKLGWLARARSSAPPSEPSIWPFPFSTLQLLEGNLFVYSVNPFFFINFIIKQETCIILVTDKLGFSIFISVHFRFLLCCHTPVLYCAEIINSDYFSHIFPNQSEIILFHLQYLTVHLFLQPYF